MSKYFIPYTLYGIKRTRIPAPIAKLLIRHSHNQLMKHVSEKALLEGPATWVWWLYLQSTVISLMRHDQGMQNYSWSLILDNLKTARNTIICSNYREWWGIYSAPRPSSGASSITSWQALVSQHMAGKSMGSTVGRVCVGIPALTVNRCLNFSATPIQQVLIESLLCARPCGRPGGHHSQWEKIQCLPSWSQSSMGDTHWIKIHECKIETEGQHWVV